MPNSHGTMIIIVGTSHTIQTTDLELKPFLTRLNQEFKVCAVAEEMSEETLAEKGCTASIPMQVASVLHLPHRFCDPNREERAELNIRQENDIRAQAFLSNPTLSEPEIQKLIAESYVKREQYWFERLRDLNLWPALFICGADHVKSFSQLVKQQGVAAHVAAKDWASNKK